MHDRVTEWHKSPFLKDNIFTSALCIDHIAPGTLVYQAASPDEEALVGAARELGWVFLSRTRDFLVVSELGVRKQYQLLALVDFTSKRRRMSVLGERSLFYCFSVWIIYFHLNDLGSSLLNPPISLLALCIFF